MCQLVPGDIYVQAVFGVICLLHSDVQEPSLQVVPKPKGVERCQLVYTSCLLRGDSVALQPLQNYLKKMPHIPVFSLICNSMKEEMVFPGLLSLTLCP